MTSVRPGLAAAAATALLWLAAPGRCLAQEPAQTNTDVPWRTSYFPYLSGLSNDGPLISGRIRYSQAAPYEERVTSRAYVQLDAGVGFRGPGFAAAQFGAPLWLKDWRFTALTIASREARYGFFGLGNGTTYDKANVTDANPFFYRVQRTNYFGSVEVTRRIVGQLQVALQASAQSTKFVAHDEGTSVFLQQFGPSMKQGDAGSAPPWCSTAAIPSTTASGLLLESGYQVATGGGNYERLYGVFRGWVQLREGTVLAARLAGSQLYGEPTLDARFVIPAWERPIPVLGGSFSFRALQTGRLAGKGVLLGNFEVRST